MPTDHRAVLKDIRTLPSLVRYLRDEMGWPIEGGDFEELTFEYTPEELGIDTASAAKIQEIKRLRPLSPRQPWGIFFVKFERRQGLARYNAPGVGDEDQRTVDASRGAALRCGLPQGR